MFGSRQADVDHRREQPLVDLKPTVYVAEVLASVGDGVTVTPVTDVPKVRLPVSAATGTPLVCTVGSSSQGTVYSGVIADGVRTGGRGVEALRGEGDVRARRDPRGQENGHDVVCVPAAEELRRRGRDGVRRERPPGGSVGDRVASTVGAGIPADAVGRPREYASASPVDGRHYQAGRWNTVPSHRP